MAISVWCARKDAAKQLEITGEYKLKQISFKNGEHITEKRDDP